MGMTAGSFHRSVELARQVLNAESQALSDLAGKIGEEIPKAIEILASCTGKVVVTGMGKSWLIAQKVASTLSSLGTPSFGLHPGEAVHGDSGALTGDDVLIAISHSGKTAETLALIPVVKAFGCKIVSITGDDSCTLARQADVALCTHVSGEADPRGIAPTSSTTAALALGDAIALCLAEIKGFTESDFLARHPAGSLGAAIAASFQDHPR